MWFATQSIPYSYLFLLMSALLCWSCDWVCVAGKHLKQQQQQPPAHYHASAAFRPAYPFFFFSSLKQMKNFWGVVRVTHKSIPQHQRVICHGGWEQHPGQQELTSVGLSLPVGTPKDSQPLETDAVTFLVNLVDMSYGSTISWPVFVWAPLSNSYRYKEGYSSSNVTIALNNYLSNVKHKNSED